ncbi:hypothetical protein [Belliella aquatica]|nr:hypothetical protein [Belliella aquatica]MCH7407443.1 hypothetical protein [Belliella aquatica]
MQLDKPPEPEINPAPLINIVIIVGDETNTNHQINYLSATPQAHRRGGIT